MKICRDTVEADQRVPFLAHVHFQIRERLVVSVPSADHQTCQLCKNGSNDKRIVKGLLKTVLLHKRQESPYVDKHYQYIRKKKNEFYKQCEIDDAWDLLEGLACRIRRI